MTLFKLLALLASIRFLEVSADRRPIGALWAVRILLSLAAVLAMLAVVD